MRHEIPAALLAAAFSFAQETEKVAVIVGP